MDAAPENFKPVLFVTLTYRENKTMDDIAIDTRKYVLWLSRLTKAHLSPVDIGYKEYDNSHAHLTIFSPDLVATDKLLEMAASKRAWGHGRADVQRYKDMGGRHYILKHKVIPMAAEVFCPCAKRSCRKNRCEHQLRQRNQKDIER